MYMMVSAMNHVHKNGITHRDMKPENVLINVEDNTLKVIDFGLAKSDFGEKETRKLMIGTPNYMAPEIFMNDGAAEAYAPPCDMWSLGNIMYLLITGLLPFRGENVPD